MQITHEEAHRLIQFNTDGTLDPNNQETLNAHLRGCADCRVYSDEVKETVSIMRETMYKHWNLRPLPLQMNVVVGHKNQRGGSSILLTTRTVIIGIAFVMFAYVAWQSVITNDGAPQQTPLGALPLIPTPSTRLTATTTLAEDCDEILYMVKENDTLEGIALQFLISKEDILSANHMTEESIHSTMELVIPLCKSTPTSTIHPPTFTTTPFIGTTTYTPG